jgi:MFS family permease
MRTSAHSNIPKIYAYKFLVSLHFFGGVLVPFFTDWGGIRFLQVMILQSFFVFSVFLLEVPTGAVADYLGRKVSLFLAALLNTIAVLVYASRPDFAIFLCGEFLWALGFALMSGADEALVYDTLKQMNEESRSKEVFGRFRSSELSALMVAAPIGSAIAAFIGLRHTMLFMSAPLFLAVLLALTFEEPATVEKKKTQRYVATLMGGVRYFRQHRILRILAFDRLSIETLAFLMIWIYQPLLKELHVPLAYFGLVHAGLTGIQIPFMNQFARLERAFGSKKKYLLWSALIAGGAFVLLGINPYSPVAVFLLLVIAGFGLSRAVLFQNYMNKHIESSLRATVISTVTMIGTLIMGLLYPLAGLLVEWSLTGTLIIIGAAIILCALLSKTREEYLLG